MYARLIIIGVKEQIHLLFNLPCAFIAQRVKAFDFYTYTIYTVLI